MALAGRRCHSSLQHRSWIFPRDKNFAEKAGRVLDLYQGVCRAKLWAVTSLSFPPTKRPAFKPAFAFILRCRLNRASQCVLSLSTNGAAPWPISAAWDVQRAKVFGRCGPISGIAPFGALVRKVMSQSPYREAKRVFWIVDNGSSHRGEAACRRLQGEFANLVLVHLPVHASWLNQIEIYFSVVQRKALTRMTFPASPAVAQRLMDFQRYYEQVAQPFEWKFTRADLAKLLVKLQPSVATAQAA